MTENTRDTPKKMDVDILFSKYFINIRAGTAQLRSKPSDRTSLLVERAFNKLPRMNHTILSMHIPITIWAITTQTVS